MQVYNVECYELNIVYQQDIEAPDEKTAKKLVNTIARGLGHRPVHFIAVLNPQIV